MTPDDIGKRIAEAEAALAAARADAMREWIASRPAAVQEAARRFPIRTKFDIHGTINYVIAYTDDGRVQITPFDPDVHYHLAVSERRNRLFVLHGRSRIQNRSVKQKKNNRIKGRHIPNTHQIVKFFLCHLCVTEKPDGQSMEEWARLNCGWTPLGFQVWCVRHQCNIAHIDLEGHKVPANITRTGPALPHDARN